MYWLLPSVLSLLSLCAGTVVFKLQYMWASAEESVPVVCSHVHSPVVLTVVSPEDVQARWIGCHEPQTGHWFGSLTVFLSNSFLSTPQHRPSGLLPACCPIPHILEWFQCLCSIHSPQDRTEPFVSLGVSLRGWVLERRVPFSQLLRICGLFIKNVTNIRSYS